MIDYEKLKTIFEKLHELAAKKPQRIAVTHSIIFEGDDTPRHYFNIHGYDFTYQDYDIEQMIKKLQELTKPGPKYKVGQTLFIRQYDEIKSIGIDEVINDDDDYFYLYYNEDGYFGHNGKAFDQYSEDELYPTKEALIQAQIDYWVDLKYTEQESCQKEQLKKAICCGKELIYAETAWSTAKCHLCGKKLQESCQHESDGMIYCSIPPNKCKKCGEFYK